MASNAQNDNKPTIDQVIITVDGTKLSASLMNNLYRVEVDSTLEMPNLFEITFRDHDLDILENGPFAVGKTIKVDFGGQNGGTPVTVAEGEVTGLEPDFGRDYIAFFKVRGYDLSHRMNRGKASQAFVNSSDSDVAASIGVSGVSITAASTTGVREHLFQDNQTPMAFLHRLARLNGYDVYANGSQVKFAKHGEANTGDEVTLNWGENMHYFYPRMTVAGQVNEVEVRGWNPASKEAVIGKATTSSVQPEINVGGWGGSVARSAISASVLIETHHMVTSQAEGDRIAQAILDEINGRFVEADGRADGNPKIVAGIKVDIPNLGDDFSGKYLVTSAHHVYSSQSYYTEFYVSGARPLQIGELASGASVSTTNTTIWDGFYPAIVTDNADPDAMGRIKVKYPWLNDEIASGWARVMILGAGMTRGIHWLPEVNDEVLVAFGHGDFNHPYVIGGLYNGKDSLPEPEAVLNGKVEERIIRTRTGHLMRFHDETGKQRIDLKDSSDSQRITQDSESPKTYIGTTNGNFFMKAENEIDKTADGNYVVATTDTLTAISSGDTALQSSEPVVLMAGDKVTVDALSQVTFASSADIKIRAVKDVEILGATINITASSVLTLKGSKVLLQGT